MRGGPWVPPRMASGGRGVSNVPVSKTCSLNSVSLFSMGFFLVFRTSTVTVHKIERDGVFVSYNSCTPMHMATVTVNFATS